MSESEKEATPQGAEQVEKQAENTPSEAQSGAEDAGSDVEMESPEQVAQQGDAAIAQADAELDDALRPFLERRERSLKELLSTMESCSPIIPDAVTDYYLSKAGFQTEDVRIKRLLALATQKFVSDIAADAYQFSRIRSQSGASNPSRRGGPNKAVLTMDDLGNVLSEYGINTKRPEFYR